MGKDKKRPQYIEKQISSVNDYFRQTKMKDTNRDSLFWWWVQYLLENGWYRGWNIHVDKWLNNKDGDPKLVRALAGPFNKMDEETKESYYVQLW